MPAVKSCDLFMYRRSSDLPVLKPKASAHTERTRPRSPLAGGEARGECVGAGHLSGPVAEKNDSELAGKNGAALTWVSMCL